MIGTRLAHYEITAHLGSGGMGDVYKATDSKLGRSVAIKLLPDAFTHNAERAARFDREARVLASLNHPNIAGIHGIEESGGRKFLVMELAPGETLAERVKRGPIPAGEALSFAGEIAQGLEAAHEKGIIHRDLKPANIKIAPDGALKILDFGLAKAFEAEGANPNLSNSPTLSFAATMQGVVLGTAAYMSPEQAKGKELDRRSDIWAFGCVLYEMLTGRAAFDGETLGEILGSVFKAEPDWTALPETTPPAILTLLKRCLQKDRSRRLRDIADARFQIEEASSAGAVPIAAAPVRSRRETLVWLAATVALAAGLILSLMYSRKTPSSALETRLEISTPPGASVGGFALSPDGRQLVYPATVEGRNQLWLRPLDSEEARPLPGTDNGSFPFWSPDSESIGFFGGGQLKRIDIKSGIVQRLADAPLNTRGGTWGSDGTIVFTHSSTEPLFGVPAKGGAAEPVTEVKPPHLGHRYPMFLPDNRHFLFFAYGPTESQGIYVGSLDSKDSKRLLDSDSFAVFVPPDYVLFARQGAILAQRINLESFTTVGEPLPVARRAATPADTVSDVALSASSIAGVIAWRAASGERQLRRVDRTGRQLGLIGGPDAAQLINIHVSPDGLTVAADRTVDGNNDIWLLGTMREMLQRFTTNPAREYGAVWSPDGSRIVFGSTRKGVIDIYEKAVGGAGTETLLLESSESKNASDWSSDGQWIVYATQSPMTARDLWALPLKGEKKPIVVAKTPAEERNGVFSPNGRWIAYESNESGRFEIYLQPFPGPGPRSQISTAGGSVPQWRRDGKELFYRGPDNRLMSVLLDLNGDRAVAGAPVALFSMSTGAQYAPFPDGQQFVLDEITKAPSPITILQNWKPR